MGKSEKWRKHLFVLGAAKCGTSYLSDLLSKSPDLCFSSPQEPLFFEAEYENGFFYYMQKYFSHCSGEPVLADGRHRNLLFPYIPERIQEEIQDPYFVVIVRDPVDRLFSHWWHWYSRGIESRSWQSVVEHGCQDDEFYGYSGDRLAKAHKSSLIYEGVGRGYSKYEAYVKSSSYREQIKRYVKLFGRARVKIVIFDDLKKEPEKVIKEILTWVGARFGSIVPPSQSLKNPAVNPNVMSLLRLGKFFGIGRFLSQERKRRIIDRISEIIPNPYKRELASFERAMRSHLVQFYIRDIEFVEDYTGRLLNEWKTRG